MRLLEIVRGATTADATILAGLALAKKLRKIGVVVGDGFGFVGNRMMLDGYFREVELMLLEGVAPEPSTPSWSGSASRWVPIALNDMAGIDVGTRVRAELMKRESRPAPYHAVSDALTALGHLGQKTGRGIYRYQAGDRTPLPEPELALLARALADKHGVAAREVADAEIEERCVLSLINVAAQILDEGLAYRAADIDVVWTSGYGFPRWRGGPMFHADTLGIERVVALIASTGRLHRCCAAWPPTAAASPTGIGAGRTRWLPRHAHGCRWRSSARDRPGCSWRTCCTRRASMPSCSSCAAASTSSRACAPACSSRPRSR
jgi:3-hydroxyacyl-CoA dehydrogenase